MMINSKEGNTENNPKSFLNPASSSSYINPTSTSWTRLKDPRIVRVSRAFGGKDRHSKVCTVKGLRDRRVRLSVPTAIQLYDLQDRLGLNQPSKVVDWLLNVAKNEIDELPPLQIPHGSFSSMISHSAFHQEIGASSSSKNIGGNIVNWNNDPPEHSRSEDHNNLENNNQGALLYVNNHSSLLQSPYNNNNSFVRWDASNVLTLSQHHHDQNPTKGNGLITGQNEDWSNFSLQLPNVVYHQNGIMSGPQSYFDQKEQVSYRSSQLPSSSQLSTANLLPMQNNDGS